MGYLHSEEDKEQSPCEADGYEQRAELLLGIYGNVGKKGGCDTCAICDPNFSTAFYPFHFLGLKQKGTSVQRKETQALGLLSFLISSFINCL